MIKKRTELKKKKSLANNIKNQKVLLSNQPQKLLFKLNGGLLCQKSPNCNYPSSHQYKIPMAVMQANKIRMSKQNVYDEILNSKKTSQTMTPPSFDNQRQLNEIKYRTDYQFIFQIGSGGFGRVWKVQQKKTNNIFAMKQMSKAKIIAKKSINSIMNQKLLLDQLSNPFIINSRSYFQDRDNLYLVMQYLRGGDLRYHMCYYQCFDEQQAKFIISCIVLSLQYIHSNRIIHRDLKPENIVFEENGYARITDFGVARKYKNDNSDQTSGTPGYMAPEVICRMNHSFQADFFALGVIIYQLIFGTRPYLGESRKEIREKILAHQAKINEKELPAGWSPLCIDFVNRLLKRNKEHRLGYNGISQIKNHPWLREINWVKLGRKQIIPPFIPGIVCQSYQYQREMENSVPSEINEEAVMLLRTTEIQKLFKNYDKCNNNVQARKTAPVKFTSQTQSQFQTHTNSPNNSVRFFRKLI